MNCRDYTGWIEVAALGALDASRRAQLDEHLALCPQCRAAFDAERKLVAAIDRGLLAGVEGKPSMELAARVRMRLAEQGERAGSSAFWRPAAWIQVMAGAALALLLLMAWFGRRPAKQHQPAQQAAGPVTPPRKPPGIATPPQQARLMPPGKPLSGVRRAPTVVVRPAHARRGQPDADTEAPQLQVQVQPGQWAAVKSLYRAGQDGRLNGSDADIPVPADQLLEVTPVNLALLVIAELQEPKPVGADEP